MDDTPGRIDRNVSRQPSDVAGRADESTRGHAESDRDDSERRTQEIRNEIEETRSEMGETIDAIQEKLNPRNIVRDATDRAKTAATERVREMADTASQTAQQAIDYTRERATSMANTARGNPLPLALIGVGTAWLFTSRSRPRGYDRDFGDYGQRWTRDEALYEHDRDRGVMGRIRQNPIPAVLAGVGLSWLALARRDRSAYNLGRAGDTADRWRERSTTDSVHQMARRRQNQLQRMIEENPLLVGAGALMIGAAFGFAVPETETENEWMGETRDNIVERARETARDAAGQVQDAASSVADAAKKLTGTPRS
jgi:hypothetical protein